MSNPNPTEISYPTVTATQLFINGKYVPSLSGKTFETVNPTNEKPIIAVSDGQPEDIDLAVMAARKAFDSGPWRRMSGSQRGKLLFTLASLLEKNAEEFARLESMDNGMSVTLAHAFIKMAIDTIRYYAGYADKVHGQVIPIEGPYLCYTRHEPVGVVGAVLPWNVPMVMASWKMGPALAMGCTMVIKPAEQTPLTALKLGELINEAGFPNGVVNIVSGFGLTAGKSLVEHPLVDKVAFTGSTEVGLEIMRGCHVSNLKRVTLELGGKSPNIILDDADIDLAIKQSQLGIYFNQGQVCIAGSRVFVQEKIYDEFVKRTVEASQKRIVGCPLRPETEQGPQVDGVQFNRVMGYIESGVKEGAKLVCGGKRVGPKGYFIQSTVFADVTDEMKIAREEIFGPVMSILKFKTIEEVIERANNTCYGLGAGVVTRNFDNAVKIANAVKAGTVYVNCYDVISSLIPFGGYKNSGLGREMGEYGLKNFTEVKTVIVKVADDALP